MAYVPLESYYSLLSICDLFGYLFWRIKKLTIEYILFYNLIGM